MTQISAFPYEVAENSVGYSHFLDRQPKTARSSTRGAWERLVSTAHAYGCRIIDDTGDKCRIVSVQPKWFLTTLKEATNYLYVSRLFISMRMGATTHKRPVTISLSTLNRLRDANDKNHKSGHYCWNK